MEEIKPMSIKNRFSIKMLLIALIALLSFSAFFTLSATKVSAATNGSQAIESWDISKDEDESLIAALFQSPTQSGKYDLVITGEGYMKDFNGEKNTPWVDYAKDVVSVSLPNGLLSIGKFSFYGFKSLTSIDIPSSVEAILPFAFAYSSNLRTVTGGSGLKEIQYNAFEACSLASFPFATMTTLTSIGARVFKGNQLTEVVLPSTLLILGDGAFSNCSKLEKVTFLGLDTQLRPNNQGNYVNFDGCATNLRVYAHKSTNVDEVVGNFITLCTAANCLVTTCEVCHSNDARGPHEGTWQEVTKPKKDSEGVLKLTCSLDSAHAETKVLPKLSKDCFEYEYKVIREATVDQMGLATYTYVIDGQSFIYTEDIPIVREGLLDEATFKDATFGIVLGAIALVAVLSFGIFWFNLKRKR